MAPYWPLGSPQSPGLVDIVLAAGKLTRTMPCTSPAIFTTLLWIPERVPEAMTPPFLSACEVRACEGSGKFLVSWGRLAGPVGQAGSYARLDAARAPAGQHHPCRVARRGRGPARIRPCALRIGEAI